MPGVAGLVLAGGRAKRLGGGDKPLLEIGGATILSRVIAALRPETDTLAISANGDPARFARFGLPVLGDGEFANQGPLAGLLAGLDWAASLGAAWLLTAPGDTPFLPPGLGAALAPAPACAARDGQVHPLVALWPVTVADTLRRMLRKPGSRSTQVFGASIGIQRVEFPDGAGDPFHNVNTPADLARARALAQLLG